jgi:hypothetical protein
MSLAPGAHIGPYEILSALGAGGIDEVFARDTKMKGPTGGVHIERNRIPELIAALPTRRHDPRPDRPRARGRSMKVILGSPPYLQHRR